MLPPSTPLPCPQDSLGGNAKTSLLVAACDAAEHVEETIQSLQFGMRAMCVRTQASTSPKHVPSQQACRPGIASQMGCSTLLYTWAVATRHGGRQLLPRGLCRACPGEASSAPPCLWPHPQAVVNERVDYKTLHAEMVAALESHDRKSSLLEASLLEKDAQLEAVQAQCWCALGRVWVQAQLLVRSRAGGVQVHCWCSPGRAGVQAQCWCVLGRAGVRAQCGGALGRVGEQVQVEWHGGLVAAHLRLPSPSLCTSDSLKLPCFRRVCLLCLTQRSA